MVAMFRLQSLRGAGMMDPLQLFLKAVTQEMTVARQSMMVAIERILSLFDDVKASGFWQMRESSLLANI